MAKQSSIDEKAAKIAELEQELEELRRPEPIQYPKMVTAPDGGRYEVQGPDEEGTVVHPKNSTSDRHSTEKASSTEKR